jgi:single-strand DNA-binding protein
MASFNKHFVTGRLGKTPELRYIPSGKEVTSFSLIRQPRRLNQQTQQWEDGDSTWYEVTMYGRLANNVVDSLEKGFEVTVVGDLKTGSYVNREGVTVATLEIIADDVLIPLDHQTVKMVNKSAYGNKVGGGTGAPASNGFNGGGYSAPAQGGYNGGGSEEEPPF